METLSHKNSHNDQERQAIYKEELDKRKAETRRKVKKILKAVGIGLGVGALTGATLGFGGAAGLAFGAPAVAATIPAIGPTMVTGGAIAGGTMGSIYKTGQVKESFRNERLTSERETAATHLANEEKKQIDEKFARMEKQMEEQRRQQERQIQELQATIRDLIGAIKGPAPIVNNYYTIPEKQDSKSNTHAHENENKEKNKGDTKTLTMDHDKQPKKSEDEKENAKDNLEKSNPEKIFREAA